MLESVTPIDAPINTNLETRTSNHISMYYILGSHAQNTEVFNKQGNFWSKEVKEQVKMVRPHQIVPDTLFVNNPPKILEDYIPLDNPGNAFPEREYVDVLGADLFYARFNQNNKLSITPIWQKILKDSSFYDKLISDPDQDANTLFSDAWVQAYGKEGGILIPSLVILALATECLPIQKASTPIEITRRRFLKGIFGATLGIAIPVVKVSETKRLFDQMSSNTDPDRNQSLARMIKRVKPIFFKNVFSDIRNIKLGLSAIDNARKLSVRFNNKEIKTAIVFGRGHSIETNPNSDEEVLLAKLKQYLITLHSYLPDLIAFGGSSETVVSELKQMFAQYDVYEIPQNQQGTELHFNKFTQENQKVNAMIDNIFGTVEKITP